MGLEGLGRMGVALKQAGENTAQSLRRAAAEQVRSVPAKSVSTVAAKPPGFAPLSGDAVAAMQRARLAAAQELQARAAAQPAATKPAAMPAKSWEDLREEDFMRAAYGMPRRER